MAEEDSEILDWGNEDDVVSLGDEDERYTLEDLAAPPQNGASETPVGSTVLTPPRSSSPQSRSNEASSATPDRKSGSSTPQPTESSKATPTAASQTPLKLPIPPRLTHALPPRPVTTNIPYVPPSDPSIVEATAMASRPKKPETVVQNPKNGSRSDHTGPARNGDDHYYHNAQSAPEQRNRPSPPSSTEPLPLSHDDRHYRPSSDRYASSSGRRYETSTDAPESRQNRHYSGASARSPPRGRDRSRSTSPGRDSRGRGNQRPARGRPTAKPDDSQRDHTADLPKDEDRHWVPSPPSNNQARSARRQHRSQNYSPEGRGADSGQEEVTQQPLQRDNGTRGYNRDRERAYTPSEHPSNMSAPRPATPPPRDDRVVIYETKVEAPRREVFEERRKSPVPAIDQNPPQPIRRERPSRFGPGPPPPSIPERPNGLPMKPVTTHNDRSGDSRRANHERQYDRRVDQDRRYENQPPQELTYVPPTNRSPVQTRETREPDRMWIPPSNIERGRASPVSENSVSSSSRKRQPLPPQEAEFRGVGRSKPVAYPELVAQRPREVPRPPVTTLHSREKIEKEVALPAPRSHAGRDDTRDVRDAGYSQIQPTRDPGPTNYERERDYRDVERARPRHRPNDQAEVDRGYETPVDHPPIVDNRGGYQERERERERDPPSKPRAMQSSAVGPPNTYLPAGSSGPPSALPNRYRDRPSPPHLSMNEQRIHMDARPHVELRPAPPPSVWPEKREERSYAPPERAPVREPRGRPALASSANSIPIGTRRNMPVAEPIVSNYPPGGSGERYERPSYTPNDVPRSARNYDDEYPRSYPEPEPILETRQTYSSRGLREDPYSQVTPDDRLQRVEKVEPAPRGPVPQTGPPPQAGGGMRQRPRPPSGRNPRFEQEPPPPPNVPPSKTWSAGYDTSPHGRYLNEPVRDPTPPPTSREPSFASSQWDHPSPSYHEPPPRNVGYRDPHGYRDTSPQGPRMEVDVPSTRQAPVSSGPYNAPVVERYRRAEPEFESQVQALLPPPPRVGNRRDQPQPPYSPETRRFPAADVSMVDIDRVGGRVGRDSPSVPFNDAPRAERPRLNERISGLPPPPPDARGVHKQPQGMRQDNGYNGEPDVFEPRAPERVNTRQDYIPLPPKTFEQRLEPDNRPLMSRGSLLLRISRGGHELPPPPPQQQQPQPPPSLRDRVQIGIKRDRDDMGRDYHIADTMFETDDGDGDLAGGRRNRKRRRPRRGGPP